MKEDRVEIDDDDQNLVLVEIPIYAYSRSFLSHRQRRQLNKIFYFICKKIILEPKEEIGFDIQKIINEGGNIDFGVNVRNNIVVILKTRNDHENYPEMLNFIKFIHANQAKLVHYFNSMNFNQVSDAFEIEGKSSSWL